MLPATGGGPRPIGNTVKNDRKKSLLFQKEGGKRTEKKEHWGRGEGLSD